MYSWKLQNFCFVLFLIEIFLKQTSHLLLNDSVKIMRINSSSGPCSPAISEAGQSLTVQHLQSFHRQLPAQVMSLGHLYSTVLFGQCSCSGTSAPGLLEGKSQACSLRVSKTQTLWPFNQLPSFWLFWQVRCRAELCIGETFPLKTSMSCHNRGHWGACGTDWWTAWAAAQRAPGSGPHVQWATLYQAP